MGGVQLAWPAGADEDAAADWLVFGAMIRTVALGENAPGLRPLGAALEEEGFEDVGSGRLVESFTRHLMAAVDTWQEQGFAAIAKDYLTRLARESDVRHEIAENGDLLILRAGKTELERHALLPALARPAWRDPATGGPRR